MEGVRSTLLRDGRPEVEGFRATGRDVDEPRSGRDVDDPRSGREADEPRVGRDVDGLLAVPLPSETPRPLSAAASLAFVFAFAAPTTGRRTGPTLEDAPGGLLGGIPGDYLFFKNLPIICHRKKATMKESIKFRSLCYCLVRPTFYLQ